MNKMQLYLLVRMNLIKRIFGKETNSRNFYLQ